MLFVVVYVAYNLYCVKETEIWRIKHHITGDDWTSFNWQAGSDSSCESSDNAFNARIVNGESDFGAVGVEQGLRAHGNGAAKPLLMEVKVNRSGNTPLILNFTLEKVSSRLYSLSSVFNVGVVLFGDVGLNYSDPDLSSPHAGVIDFYYHVTPFWHGETWSPPGSSPYDSDYRAGKVMLNLLGSSEESRFQSRIDDFITKFLAQYDLPFFTIKLVQAYAEAKNAEGEIVISEVVLGLP